ncbi:MAG: hypothetical protein VX346_15015 [Planctomycetota bacterium]|nr:hypothetical protein [Planctomycetota bacterium]
MTTIFRGARQMCDVFFRRTSPIIVPWCFTLFCCVLAVPLTVSAQRAVDEAPGEAAQQAKPEGPAESRSELREQTIYIPYTKLRGIFEKEGRGVFIPYEQFQQLWKKARAGEVEPVRPESPVKALLTEVSNQATVAEDVVRVHAKIKIEVLHAGWHSIPLRLKGAALLSARLGDLPARIVMAEDGYRLLLEKREEGPAQFLVELVYAKAIRRSPGQNLVKFQAPQAPVNRWVIRVPQAGVKVNIQPLIAASETTLSRAAGDEVPPGPVVDETVVLAFVGAAPEVQISWTPRSEGATGLAALASVRVQQQVTINEGVMRTQARLDYNISRAEVEQLVIEVPRDQKVINVFDPNVRQWKVVEAGEIQQVQVQLFQPARGSQTLTIELEQFSEQWGDREVAVPLVRARDAGRQQGLLVVRLSPALRAEVSQRTGLLQLDKQELPGTLQKIPWDFAYRYATLPYQLAFRLEKIRPRVHARQLIEVHLEPEQLTINLMAVLDIQRAGVFQVELEIPAGFEIRQVRGQAIARDVKAVAVDSHHVTPAADTRLIVNLGSKAQGKVGLFVELQKRLEDPNLVTPTGNATDLSIGLPRVAADRVERVSGNVVIYAPESLRATPTVSEGLQTISFKDAYAEVTSQRQGRFSTTRPILAYAHSEQSPNLVLSTERRRPQITVRQLLAARIETGYVDYRATFFFDVLYSGVSSLRVDVPQTLEVEIRNLSNALNEQRMEPQPADVIAGYVAMSFTGETELLGEIKLELNWQEKILLDGSPSPLGIGDSRSIPIPVLKPQGVDLASGQIVIAKGESLDVRESADVSGLQPIDPQSDLYEGVEVADAARAFEFHGEWELGVTATRFKLEDIKRTSIERAVLRMVVTKGQEISVQALYRLRSARQRLEIKFPNGFNPETSLDRKPQLNGRIVDLERGEKDEFYLPLANQTPEDPFLLELRYTIPGDHQRLDFPEFPERPAMQKVYLCAYLPSDLALLGSHGPWTSDYGQQWRRVLHGGSFRTRGDVELVNWVLEDLPSESNPLSDFQTQGELYTFSTLRPTSPPDGSLRLTVFRGDALHMLVFVAVAVPGVVLVTLPLWVRLFSVGLVAIGLVSSGIFFPTFSLQTFDWSLVVAFVLVLAVWMLMFLLRFVRQSVQSLRAGSSNAAMGNVAAATSSGALVLEVSTDSPDDDDSPFRAASDPDVLTSQASVAPAGEGDAVAALDEGSEEAGPEEEKDADV